MNFRNLITNKTFLIFGAGVLLLLSAAAPQSMPLRLPPKSLLRKMPLLSARQAWLSPPDRRL